MLLSTAATKLNRFIAPAILKHGLTLRFVLLRGQIHRDTPTLDNFLLLPLAQTLLSLEVQAIAKEEREEENNRLENKNQEKSALDQWFDDIWEKYLERLSPPALEEQKEVRDNDNENANANKTPRLRALERFITPVLNPTQEWSDIERWRYHSRFIKWLRSEYLICKYEDDIRTALSTHSKLRVTPLLMQNQHWMKETIRKNVRGTTTTNNKGEFAPLPSGSILDQAFGMKGWNKSKSVSNEYTHMGEIAKNKLNGDMLSIPGSTVQLATIPYETSTAELSLEEILEVTGCHVSSCSAFNALCDELEIYEFWTEEYVQSLTSYLVDRSKEYDSIPTVVVDIGAGDGTLVHFLNANLSEYVYNSGVLLSSPGVGGLKKGLGKKKKKKKSATSRNKPLPTIIATDNGDWRINPKAPVEQLSVKEALKKYSPFDENGIRKHQLVILCSWMPMGIDWTEKIRAAGVDEYILIGECDDGNCGHNWLSFGNGDFRHDEGGEDIADANMIRPYEVDGFERIDVEDLSLLQYSKFDSKVSGTSKTISFRRTGRMK